jgi:tetratricopeptide (TPR) repeat protein
MQQALEVLQKLYPKEKYPQGHPALTLSLNNLGYLLQAQGEYARAEPFYREALTMRQQLYPQTKYPQGHPALALSLNNLGYLLRAQGKYARAEPILREALAMRQQLYPRDRYPQGHPDLAMSLSNLGALLRAQGKYAKAEPFCREALAMFNTLSSRVAPDRPRGAGPQLRCLLAPVPRRFSLGHTPAGRCCLIELCTGLADQGQSHARLRTPPSGSASGRIAPDPRPLAAVAHPRPPARTVPAGPPCPPNATTRDQKLAELNRTIDQLDQELPALVPAVAHAEQVAQSHPSALQDRLPEHTILIDLLRYTYFDQDPKTPGKKGERRTPSYLAYVLTRDRVERVELGAAQPIEDLVHDWRASFTAWQVGLGKAVREDLEQRAARQAETLRRLVWEPLAPHVPNDTQTIYLAPDAVLTQLPLAALPGRGTVLLEDYALAVLPAGPFLLGRLTTPGQETPRPVPLLAVGGVRYEDRPVAVPGVSGPDQEAARSETRSGPALG